MAIVILDGSWFAVGSLGTVWDGTKSTGPKEWALQGGAAWTGLLALITEDGSPAAQTSTTEWMFTALDANGNDVGFTCRG
jgi:hypothetical protein